MKGICLAVVAFAVLASVCLAQDAAPAAPSKQDSTAPVISVGNALERSKRQVAGLPGESMDASLQVIADLKKGDGTKAVADWLDPGKGERPSMVSSLLGSAALPFDTPVNGQITVTAPLVAGASSGADLNLALPATSLLAREQGMVGGLTAVHMDNKTAVQGLSDFMDANLGPKQGQVVIDEFKNLDAANIKIAKASAFGPLGASAAAKAGTMKAQLEAQLSGQFDQAISTATQAPVATTDQKK